MIVSLMFSCPQHYVCIIKMIILCLFVLLLSFMLEVSSTESLLKVHSPFGVFHRESLFGLLLLPPLGQKSGPE